MTANNNNLNLSETEKRLETAPAKGSIEKAFDQAVETIQKRLEKSLNKIAPKVMSEDKKTAILWLIKDIQDSEEAALNNDRIDKIKSVLSDKNVPDDIKEQIAWLYGYATEINDLESSYKAELWSLVNWISSEITSLFANFPENNAKKISSAFKEVKAEGINLTDEGLTNNLFSLLSQTLNDNTAQTSKRNIAFHELQNLANSTTGAQKQMYVDVLKRAKAIDSKKEQTTQIFTSNAPKEARSTAKIVSDYLQSEINEEKDYTKKQAKIEALQNFTAGLSTVSDLYRQNMDFLKKAPAPATPETNNSKENEQEVSWDLQTKSSHIEYTLEGHNFVIEGTKFDISANGGMIDALAFIAANGNIDVAKTLKKGFKAINLNGFDAIMAESLREWPDKWYDKKALTEIWRRVWYKKDFDLRADYANIALVFSKLGKDWIQKLYDARQTRIDVKELANATASKESLNKVTGENVFDFIVDRDNSGALDGQNVKERFSEKSLLDTILDVANYETKNNKQSLVDGPQTVEVIKGFIAHAEWRGMVSKWSIDSQFNNKYTLENLALVIKEHPEYKVYYLNSLVDFTGNKQFDLHDLVRADTYKKLLESENIKIDKNLNVINEENKIWFEDQINQSDDPATQEWYMSLWTAEKASAMFTFTKFLKKFSAITGLMGITAQDGKPLDTKAIMASSVMKIKKFESVDGKWPRLEPMFSFKTETVYSKQTGEKIQEIKLPTDFFIWFIVPLADLEKEWRVNRGKLNSASEDAILSLNSIYAWLSPRLGIYINAGGFQYFKKDMRQFIVDFAGVLNVTDPKISAQLQWNLWFEKDYRSWVEYMSNKFSERLQKMFDTKWKTTLNEVRAQFSENLKSMKSDKEIAKYEKQNPGRLQSYIDMMISVLDATGTMDIIRGNSEAAKNLDIAIMSFAKWLVAENEKEKYQDLSGSTKIAKVWLFGGIGESFNLRWWDGKNWLASVRESRKTLFSFGANISLSSFLVKYAPDKEKYLYMDESLKSGSDVRPIEWVALNDWVEKIAQKLQQRLNVNGLLVNADKNRIVLSLDAANPVNTSDGKQVDSIATLLNIYVDPKEKNVSMSADNKKLIVGDAESFGYINRNYFNDQAHYLIIGKGWVEWKTWVRKSDDLSTQESDVKQIQTEFLTNDKLKAILAQTLNVSSDNALLNELVPASIKIDEQNKNYKYLDGENWKTLDVEKNGIEIDRDTEGKQIINLTNRPWKIEIKAMNISQPVDTKDILNQADKETYDKARELITEIKFGPLVSMYEKRDSGFQKQVNAYRKTKRKNTEDKRTGFIEILDYLTTNIAKKSGIKSIDQLSDAQKNAIKEKIVSVKNGLNNCKEASSCDFLMRIFDAEFANSLPNALKNWTIKIDDLDDNKRIVRWNQQYTPQRILDMNLQEYTEDFLWRSEATRATLNQIWFGNDWPKIAKSRKAIMKEIRKEKSWSLAENPSLDFVWNINMSRSIRSFSLLPIGAAHMAVVNGKELVSQKDDKKSTLEDIDGSIKNKLIDDLKINKFAGYKELLNLKTKINFTDEQMEDLLKKWTVVIGDKTINATTEAKFGFYGECLNDALMLSISNINVKWDINWSAILGKLTGMDFKSDAQTLTWMGALNQVDLNVAVSTSGIRNDKKTEAGSEGGGQRNGDRKNGDSSGSGWTRKKDGGTNQTGWA